MIDMSPTFLVVGFAILVFIIISIVRVIAGPGAPNRVVGLDTINTLVVAGMVVFGAAFRSVTYVDVAIVYALLSFVGTIYIAKCLEQGCTW